MASIALSERDRLVRRGRALAYLTIGWNAIEGVTAIAAGIAAGSIALVGFGVDSYVEVLAGGVIAWRLGQERHGAEGPPAPNGKRCGSSPPRSSSSRWASASSRCGASSPARTPTRACSGSASPWCRSSSCAAGPGQAQRRCRVGEPRGASRQATETVLCVWLSAILLVGLGANALLGWWWADPLAALGVVYVAARRHPELARRRARRLLLSRGRSNGRVEALDPLGRVKASDGASPCPGPPPVPHPLGVQGNDGDTAGRELRPAVHRPFADVSPARTRLGVSAKNPSNAAACEWLDGA